MKKTKPTLLTTTSRVRSSSTNKTSITTMTSWPARAQKTTSVKPRQVQTVLNITRKRVSFPPAEEQVRAESDHDSSIFGLTVQPPQTSSKKAKEYEVAKRKVFAPNLVCSEASSVQIVCVDSKKKKK